MSASSLISNETADPESSIISKVLPASFPVRVEALDLTTCTDTVTVLSLFRPTGKRAPRPDVLDAPFVVSLPIYSSFQHGHTGHMCSNVDYNRSGV